MDLRGSVIRTVCYFDIFDFPLTRAETQRWLFGAGAVSFLVIDEVVSQLINEGILKEEKGMLSLFDRDGLADLRVSRYRYCVRKWRRARRWARLFSAFPGVELVGVGNTLAYHNAKDDSDIDFFIIAKSGTIWRTRFLCAGLAAFFNLRPTPKESRDKLCLSFFVDSEHVDIYRHCERVAMTEDIYLHYWIRQMVPLAGFEDAAKKFIAANAGTEERGVIDRSKLLAKMFSLLGRLPGDLFKDWQTKHFPQALRQAALRGDGSVIVSDSVLKFHIKDRREDVYKKWKNRVDSILS